MKKLFTLTLLLSLIMGIVSSCSKDNKEDAHALLATVPSSSAMTGIIDLETVLEKAGCDIDGSQIKPSKELSEAIAGIKDEKQKKTVSELLDGDSGVRPSVMVFFVTGSRPYLTGLLEDTSKFKTFVEKQTGKKFADNTDGVSSCGEYAVKGDQFWIADRKSSVAQVPEFTRLSESQSFLQSEFAKGFLKLDNDMRIVVDINGMANNTPGLSFQNRAMFSAALSTLFNDASHAMLTLDFKKEEVAIDGKVLDKNGNIAKFNLPVSKIDIETVKQLGGTADIVAAMSVSRKLVSKIEDIVNSIGGGQAASLYTSILKPIDGTVAAAFSNANPSAPRAIITTDGSAANELTSQLSGVISVEREGKLLLLGKNNETGKGLALDQAADNLKGAFIGAVVADQDKYPGVKFITFGLYPEGQGLEFKLRSVTDGKDGNVLKTAIRLASRSK